MLNGIAPILIFNFKQDIKLLAPLSKIPLLEKIVPSIPLPAIPLYLDENITGLVIDSQSKSIDVETKIEDSKDPNPIVRQSSINSIVTINMVATPDSIGMILLSLFCDNIFSGLVELKENYSIDYINKTNVLFGALFHSFSAVQNSTNDMYNVSLQLSKGRVKSTIQNPVAKIIQPFFGNIPTGVPGA